MMVGSSVISFTSSAIRSQITPYPYLHLAYPKELAATVVRTSPRTPIEVSVTIHNPDGQKHVSAIATDISLSGARLISDRPLADVGKEIALATVLSMEELNEPVRLPATIRNVHEIRSSDAEAETQYQYGIEFTDLGDRLRLVLIGFVFWHLNERRAG